MRRLRVAVVLLLAVFWIRTAIATDKHVTVALDFTGLSDRQYTAIDGLALEKHLVLRLVQEGFAVVTPLAHPDITIRVEVRQNVLVLRRTLAGRAEMRQAKWDRGTELDWMHLELAQKVAELARTALAEPEVTRGAEGAPSSSSNSVLAPTQTSARFPTNEGSEPSAAHSDRANANPVQGPSRQDAGVNAESTSLGPRRRSLAVRVAAGAAIRPPAVDPSARLDLGLRIGGLWWAQTGIGLTPSSGPGIRLFEAVPTFGAAVEFPAGANWMLSAGARAGVLLHAYTFSTPRTTSSSGLAIDPVFALPLRISRRLFPSLWLNLMLAPVVATRGRNHLLDGKSIWERGPGQLELLAGVTVVP